MKPDSLIHLRVPAATKGRWVRASRASGMRLTDWIVDAVEAHMQQQQAHRQHGGGADPVADDLFTEALIEGAAGQHVSHAPGRA